MHYSPQKRTSHNFCSALQNGLKKCHLTKFESQIFFQVSLFLRDQSIFRLGGRGGEGPSILRGSHSFQEEQRGDQLSLTEYRGGGGYRKLTADGGGVSHSLMGGIR